MRDWARGPDVRPWARGNALCDFGLSPGVAGLLFETWGLAGMYSDFDNSFADIRKI